MDSVEENIQRLTNQLTEPGLLPYQEKAIREKIDYLQSLQQKE